MTTELNREKIAEIYQVDENGTIVSPGKFEGEPWYVPIFWDLALDGGANTLDWPDDSITDLIELDDAERVRFDLPTRVAAIHIGEDQQGFVWHEPLTITEVEQLHAKNAAEWAKWDQDSG